MWSHSLLTIAYYKRNIESGKLSITDGLEIFLTCIIYDLMSVTNIVSLMKVDRYTYYYVEY